MHRYRGIAGRLRFATSAYCIIGWSFHLILYFVFAFIVIYVTNLDIIVITASLFVLCMGATGQVLNV